MFKVIGEGSDGMSKCLSYVGIMQSMVSKWKSSDQFHLIEIIV